MKKYIYMAVAAIAALSSCSSDNDVIMEETVKQPLKFTASMEGATTRATFDRENKCVSWEVNDKILIMANTQTSFYSYQAESAGLTTTFTPWNEQYVVDPNAGSYEAYFGCDIMYSTPQKPIIPWTLYETWAEGKFNMPMYATSTTHDFQFKNLCGVLKIKVTNEQITAVKSIKLSSANKAIAGSFTVDANNAAVLDDPDDMTNARTIIYNSAVPTTAEGTVFYVAVPAHEQPYRELNIALNDGNGSIKNMTTKAGRDITVDRNKIYPITFSATSYAASFENRDPGNSPFTGYRSSTLRASNADVSVSLALIGDRDPQWNDMGGLQVRRDAKLTITVTPATGVTVSGIEYLYSGGDKKVTKTGAGPWEFDVKADDRKVYDGSTELHNTFSGFYGIVVNYTK